MSETPNQTPEAPLEEDILLDHNYDGIQEYDNPLPGWWKAIFWGTIIYCVPYTWWYHFADGNDVYSVYDADVAAHQQMQGQLPQADADLAQGKALFAASCAMCHAPDGGGVPNLGFNLCDDVYKAEINSKDDLFDLIRDGVPGTAMVAQSAAYDDAQLNSITEYVISLYGTTPANPLPPVGDSKPNF
jgi:cytochrome c oxidase cbb3-type subunit 3